MNIARFPRLRMAHLPTRLEPLEGLSKHLGGPKIWIKRDDCTGLAGGGNKTRKLEFLIADARQSGADTIITQGAIQSNHVRQTCAAAARHGFACQVLLEDRTGSEDPDYLLNGNVLLDQLCGAKLNRVPGNTDMDRKMENLAAVLREKGATPYIIPCGGSNPTGALGYVNAAFELVQQANDTGLVIDQVVHATGSAGTQAGLLAGMAALNSGIPVLGIGVQNPAEKLHAKVLELARQTAQRIQLATEIGPEQVMINGDYVGKAYGIPSQGALEAIRLVARLDGILLDPVYSGKGMAGLIDLVTEGRYSADQNIVFIHTGGSQALFAYRAAFGF